MTTRRIKVAKGDGFYHSQKVQYSEDTKKLLRVLIEESKLTNLQRQHLSDAVHDGRSLPPLPSRGATPEISKNVKFVPKPRKRRTWDTIIQMGAYEQEKFVPVRSRVNHTKEKEKLQNIMEFGKNLPWGSVKEQHQSKKVEPKKEKNRLEELIEEVRDRREFLQEMAALGEAKKYEHIIRGEIAAKLREVKALDKEHYAEVEDLVKQWKSLNVNSSDPANVTKET